MWAFISSYLLRRQLPILDMLGFCQSLFDPVLRATYIYLPWSRFSVDVCLSVRVFREGDPSLLRRGSL